MTWLLIRFFESYSSTFQTLTHRRSFNWVFHDLWHDKVWILFHCVVARHQRSAHRDSEMCSNEKICFISPISFLIPHTGKSTNCPTFHSWMRYWDTECVRRIFFWIRDTRNSTVHFTTRSWKLITIISSNSITTCDKETRQTVPWNVTGSCDVSKNFLSHEKVLLDLVDRVMGRWCQVHRDR